MTQIYVGNLAIIVSDNGTFTGDPLHIGHLHTAVPHCSHSRAPLFTQPCPHCSHSRAPLFTQPCPHCSHSRAPGEQWAWLNVFTLQGCVQAARLSRGSPVTLPGRSQAVIWTNAGILWIGPLVTYFSDVLIEIISFHLRKCIWKCRLRNAGIFVRPRWVLTYTVCFLPRISPKFVSTDPTDNNSILV